MRMNGIFPNKRTPCGQGGRVVWGVGPKPCDLAGWRVRFPSLPGHATLPTTGASVNLTRYLYVEIVYMHK